MKNVKLKISLLFLLVFSIGLNAQTKKAVTPKKTAKAVATKTSSAPKMATSNSNDGIFADIETSKGKITVQLEYKKTPITVANFIALAEGTNPYVKADLKGKPFYNGLKFHRVIKDFMIQGGDPLGNGSGDPGYKFKDEFTDLVHDKGGILSMANSGPGTNGSQFFITHKDTPWLNGKYTIFGHSVSGMEVINAIVQDDVIKSISIVRKGADANKFDAVKVFSSYYGNKGDDEAKAEREKLIAKEKVLKEFSSGSTTASGLKYIVLKEGTGNMPKSSSNIKVHYTGSLIDGTVFDSSVKRGEPIDFPLSNVIPGWIEGLQLMKEGAKYKFFIPYNLAYGERGMGPIPAKSDLIFEVELLKINE